MEYYEANLPTEKEKEKAGTWFSSADGDQGRAASFGAPSKKRKSQIKRLGLVLCTSHWALGAEQLLLDTIKISGT